MPGYATSKHASLGTPPCSPALGPQVMRNVGDPHEWVGAVKGKLLVRTGGW